MALTLAPPQPSAADDRRHHFDMRALRRLAAWGGAATIALAAVAITSRTQSGADRIRSAIAHATVPVVAIATAQVPKPTIERVIVDNAETRRLASEVRSLTTDRERLAARIAELERGLHEITGSIKRQADQNAAVTAAAVAASPSANPGAAAAGLVPQAPAPLSIPLAADTIATWPDNPQARDPAGPEDVPLPPTKIASAPVNDPKIAPSAPVKPEFGIALAGATSVEITRMQWAAVKANFGPLLAGLHPRAMHDPRNGATHFRLVVGPLPTHNAAAKLCAQLIAAHAICNPVKFAGEPLQSQ
jgi:hypothetical protein